MINFAEFKKFFLLALVGSLIVSALTAVVTILMGEFNETAEKVLVTLLMVVVHSLVSLGFIWENTKQHTFEKLTLFTNVAFLAIVVSFITSILGIWNIIAGELVFDLYSTYVLILIAALHIDILSKMLKREGYLDGIIYTNYLFIALVVGMILPIVYITNAEAVLGEFYFRVLAAAGIIDGTLSILSIIFYKIHVHNHPEVGDQLSVTDESTGKKKGLSLWLWILIIYLIFQVIGPLVVMGGMWAGGF